MSAAIDQLNNRRKTGAIEVIRPQSESGADNEMVTRKDDDRIDRLLTLMEAQQANGNGKSRTMLMSMWFSPLIVVLSIGYSAVTQNSKQQFNVESVQTQITQMQEARKQEDLKVWATVEAQDQLIQNLRTEIAVLKDRLQRK